MCQEIRPININWLYKRNIKNQEDNVHAITKSYKLYHCMQKRMRCRWRATLNALPIPNICNHNHHHCSNQWRHHCFDWLWDELLARSLIPLQHISPPQIWEREPYHLFPPLSPLWIDDITILQPNPPTNRPSNLRRSHEEILGAILARE